MGKCQRCGKDAGLFASTCELCNAEAWLEQERAALAPDVAGSPGPGNAAAGPPRRVGLVERLDTPAPRRERSGFIAFVVVVGLVGVARVVWGVSNTSSFLFVSGVVLLALLVLALVRRPWAHSLLILGIGALGVLSGLLMVAGRTEQMTRAASAAFWWSVAMYSWLAYFWRRRWWFGIQMPLPVPEHHSPQGGMLALFAASMALTILIMLVTSVASRLASL